MPGRTVESAGGEVCADLPVGGEKHPEYSAALLARTQAEIVEPPLRDIEWLTDE